MTIQAQSTISDLSTELNALPQLTAAVVKTVERAGTNPLGTCHTNVTRTCSILIDRSLGESIGGASGFYLYTKNAESVPYVYMKNGAIVPFWSLYYAGDDVIGKFNGAIKIWSEVTPYTKRKIREALTVDLVQAKFLR